MRGREISIWMLFPWERRIIVYLLHFQKSELKSFPIKSKPTPWGLEGMVLLQISLISVLFVLWFSVIANHNLSANQIYVYIQHKTRFSIAVWCCLCLFLSPHGHMNKRSLSLMVHISSISAPSADKTLLACIPNDLSAHKNLAVLTYLLEWISVFSHIYILLHIYLPLPAALWLNPEEKWVSLQKLFLLSHLYQDDANELSLSCLQLKSSEISLWLRTYLCIMYNLTTRK